MKKLFTICALLLCQLCAIAQANDFNPTLPDHPGQSGWDETTGALVVTYFTPGQLFDAIRKATEDANGNGQYSKVRSLTVAGNATNRDMSNLSSLKPYLRLLDLSRTAGITETNGTFERDTVLTTVLLPASIERIGAYAFQDSPLLESVTCYATTPPEMVMSNGKYPFDGCSAALTIYVPAESLPLYATANGWKDLQLMPITQGVHSLTVSLPASANMQQLKDLFLELTNTKTAQTQRYVLTSRTQYTFPNLISGTQYNIYIRNAREDILASILGVEINDESVQVSFADLKPLRDATIQLLDPQGNSLPSLGEGSGVGFTWTDALGNYLATGPTLTAQVDGTKAIARIKLGQILGTQYQQPADTLITMGEAGLISLMLQPLPQAEISGTVTAAATGRPIRHASIAVTQQLNGLYPVTLTATTDNDGHYALTAYDAPTEITAQATGYVPQATVLAGFADESQDFSLTDLTGTTITLNLAYTPATRPGEQPTAERPQLPSLGTGLVVSLYDETHNQELSGVVMQNDRLVLQDQELPEGTRLRITATSPAGLFAPATATCTIGSDGTATATLALTQLGQLKATFSQTDNADVVAMLYDADGQLFGTAYYETPTEGLPQAWLSRLPDGQYTLVTMGESQLFNGVQTLDALTEMRLAEGRDYIRNEVSIQAGRIDSLHNQTVPMLDESVFTYTGEHTDFTASKSSLTVGNYVTLRAQVDFKAGVEATNVSLAFDLPNGCELVEGSVMAGNTLAQYRTDGRRITVPLTNTGDQVRFCVMPTADGYYKTAASVSFSSGSNGVTQPIGSVDFTVESMAITVPERVPNERVSVCGTALGNSSVKIFDGNTMIGQTEAGPEGSWMMRCSLVKPYNLSEHPVHAEITTPDGITLQTSEQTVTVSQGTLMPVVYATTSNTSGVIKWDFRDYSVNSKSYAWPLAPADMTFTFKVDFMDGDRLVNDSTIISNVTLYVLCSDDTYVILDAPYNDNLHKWVVQYDFNMSASPKNVVVTYVQDEHTPTDRQQMDDEQEDLEQAIAAMQQRARGIYQLAEQPATLSNQAVYDELNTLLAIADPDIATQNRINTLLSDLVGDQPATAHIDANALRVSIKTPGDERYQWRDEILGLLATAAIIDTTALQKPTGDMDFVYAGMHYTTKKLAAINGQELLKQGYTEMPMTDGTSIYYLMTDSVCSYIDTRNATQYTMVKDHAALSRRRIVQPTIKPIFDQEAKRQFIDIFRKGGKVDQWQKPFEAQWKYDDHWDVAELKDGDGWKEEAWTQNVNFDEVDLIGEILELTDKLYQSGMNNIEQQVDELYRFYSNHYDQMLAEARTTVANAQEHLRECRATGIGLTDAVAMMEQARKYEEYVNNFMQEMTAAKQTIDAITGGIHRRLHAGIPVKGRSEWADKSRELEGTPIGLVLQLYKVYFNIREGQVAIRNWVGPWQFWKSRNPCKDDQAHYYAIKPKIINKAVAVGLDVMTHIEWWGEDFAAIDFIPHNHGVTPQWFLTQGLYNILLDRIYGNTMANNRDINDINVEISKLECDKKKKKQRDPNRLGLGWINPLWAFEPPQYDDLHPDPVPIPEWAKPMDVNAYHDPSGYVYEAVSSNRLEGVRATCYYKETVEDMYGDLHENVVVWNAEEYAQENPLFTDAEGMYRWDVPQGLWQVKYEKEGYETAYSEWLPVPPPQLEVNVGMTQLRQPAVSRVKAYNDGIEITFDKYMRPATLAPSGSPKGGENGTPTIIVTHDGQVVPGRIELLNADIGYETPDSVYASKVRFIPLTTYLLPLTSGDKLLLTIKKAVESYAGLQMEQDFTQQFDVEQRIEAIVADTLLYIAEGTERTITVSILPAEAAQGKTITATSLAPDVVTVSPAHAEGAFVVSANGLGSSAVRFCLTDDPSITATTLIHVRDTASMYVYTPTASRMSGTEIYRGAQIKLSCRTAGATILYTLDGSCPCDPQSPSVLTYRGPIVATGDDLTIRAMAVANGMGESDVAEFRYTVIDNVVAIEAPTVSEGSPAGTAPVLYYRLDGRRSTVPQRGLNIVRYSDGSIRKITMK